MRRPALLSILLAAVAAAPAFAYTIYLTDGTRLIAKEKYAIQGTRALITLPSGTVSSFPATEIDVARTEAANQNKLGTAVMIEGGKQVEIDLSKPKQENPNKLAKLIADKKAGVRAVNQPTAIGTSRSASADKPMANVASGSRSPLRNVEISSALRGYVLARGMAGVEIFEGRSTRQPLLVYEATSEAAVFKALVVSANALLVAREAYGGQLDAVEVLCETPNAGRGGHFVLDKAKAETLVSGKVDLAKFFVDNVLF